MTEFVEKPLAVTMGDPAGIGLDITLCAWASREREPLPPFVLLACPVALRARASRLGLSIVIHEITDWAEASAASLGELLVLPVPLTGDVTPGTPSLAYAQAVLDSITLATTAVASGKASALVTNPISKAVLYSAGFRHPGHTEFLAELASRHAPGRSWTPVMMLACDDLRVVPLTIHIPLKNVPAAVTAVALDTTIRITVTDLQDSFGVARPRLVIAGLNPHAGESGTIGREDLEILAPAIQRLRREGFDVRGPLSADTMFHAAARRTYDAAICMYHDQALIPIKTLAFDSGVNVTLGLPFVRTSPDHGTAFDIAGSGRASAASFVAALRMADRMAKARALARRPR